MQGIAQNGVLTNAILYYQDGEFLKAKDEIDIAVKNEKTMASAKAWYYRGMIYKSVAEQDATRQQFPGALDSATVSFLKAKSLDKAGGEYVQMSSLRLQDQWVNATNEGVKFYQSANYTKAIKAFQLAHLANQEDTTALLYGSYAAIASKDLKEACSFCEQLKAQAYTKNHVYATCANYYESINNNTKVQQELEHGLEKNPNDVMLLQELANAYISSNQNEKAVETLTLLEKAKPNDELVLTNIAVQYQKANRNDKAEAYYLKALGKNPQNFISLFNLAGLYVDQGRGKMNTYNSLKADQVKKEGATLKADLITTYTKALDYGKKALPLAESSEDQDKLQKMTGELELIIKSLNK
jgi:tetratricopeptide (TPR) repeat protein